MSSSWRALQSLHRSVPRSLAATYSAGAEAADRVNVTLKSSKGAVLQEPLFSGSIAAVAKQIAGVGAQIAEVAGSIKSVQGQIVEVTDKLESTKVALDKAELPPEKQEILMLVFKGLMDKEKGLMDKEKGLMDEKKGLMDEKKGLMDKEKGLMGTQSLPAQSSGPRQSWSGRSSNEWWNSMIAGGLFLAAIAAFNKDTDRWIESFFKSLTNSLATSRPIFQGASKQAGAYISRPALEGKILAVYEKVNLNGGYYTIVYGVKGAGKSTSVQAALGDKTGVVVVRVAAGDTREKVIASIYHSCKKIRLTSSSSKEITDAMLAATKERGGRPMTVVFEVESASSSDVVMNVVKHIAKEFAEAANVLLVLSEANAVLGFGEDPRQKFIFVDEMTREEARKFVEKRNLKISSDDFNKFADKCGTRPMPLEDFCLAVRDGQTVDEHIGKVLDLARGDLVAFIHKPILAALKKTPGGVHHTFFDAVKDNGALLSSPKDVVPGMKKVGAIMFDFEAREYKLFSKAHQTALETYDPLGSAVI